jgi:iron(III) transport system ATP-binding protein
VSSPVAVRDLSVSYDGVRVLHDVSVSVSSGSTLVLLGPSGCGKTTLLRTIAGLESPDAGAVLVADRDVTALAPEKRRVGMVFQDWALFPHMTVAQNVGYGLPRGERTGPRVDEALAMVGLSGLGDRSPGTLSGGQQQRVALARALAPRPSVLLLDEPFSNLDTALRVQVRGEVARLLADLAVTTIFVTHDQEEAFILGDEVAVMLDGRIVQHDTPAAVYDTPATAWVASFVGDANLVDGVADAGAAVTALGSVPLRAPVPDGDVRVLVRPESLELVDGSAATVVAIEYYGHDTVYEVEVGGAALRSRHTGPPRHVRGDTVGVAYRGEPTSAFPR